MPDVQINGQTFTIERFTYAKGQRIKSLLRLLEGKMPDITDRWATFRKEYAEKYVRYIPRINAIAQFGDSLDHISEEEWERAEQKLPLPAVPSTAEMVAHMAPMIFDSAEDVVLQILALLITPNETVASYVKGGDLTPRLNETVETVLMNAMLDELIELACEGAEIIDDQIFGKLKRMGAKAGNVARLFGFRTTTTPDPQESGTSSEPPVRPSFPSSEPSQSDTDGFPTPSVISTGTTASAS